MPPRSEPVSARLLRDWGLPDPGGSKYDRGTLLVVGGALRSPGAVVLAAIAALRVGAGRVTLGVPRSVSAAIGVGVPESGIVPLPETASGSVRADAHVELSGELGNAQAVLIGSGLDDIAAAEELVTGIASEAPEGVVLVLDAFALAALAARPSIAAGRRGLVLTPNPKELGVLLGEDVEPRDLRGIRRAAREVARRYGAVVATQSFVASEESAWTLRAGGPGLGTSGSGDVLAGAVAGFAARGVDPAHAAVWGTHVHAASGDALAPGPGGLGYLARELPDLFPALIADLLRTGGRTTRP